MVALVVASCTCVFWNKWLAVLWIVVIAIYFVLMLAAISGLYEGHNGTVGRPAADDHAGPQFAGAGVPAGAAGCPGRRSHASDPYLCSIYAFELVRGVPLISVLFMARSCSPLFMPQGLTIDVLDPCAAGITLFAAAYMAEVNCGGLQAMPKGHRSRRVAGSVVLADAVQDHPAAGSSRWWCLAS